MYRTLTEVYKSLRTQFMLLKNGIGCHKQGKTKQNQGETVGLSKVQGCQALCACFVHNSLLWCHSIHMPQAADGSNYSNNMR